MSKCRIKKGDEVMVIAGRDKGRTGKVIRVLESGSYLEVEGVNLVKKHVKPNPQLERAGGIIEREAKIHRSNVAVLNPATGKADKIAYKILEDGTKVRVFKSNQEVVDI